MWLEFISTLKDTTYNGIARFDFHKKILGLADLRFRFQIYFSEKCEKLVASGKQFVTLATPAVAMSSSEQALLLDALWERGSHL